MGERRGAYRVLVEKPEGRRPFGRRRSRWKIILKRVFKKWDGALVEIMWLSVGTSGGIL
jgi:hypothetical protein